MVSLVQIYLIGLDITFGFGIVSLCTLLPYLIVTGEINLIIGFVIGGNGADFIYKYITNCLACLCHTYLTLMAVTVAGSDGVNISNILKDVGLTFIGFVYFDDVQLTIEIVVGLSISFVAALFYIRMKILQNDHISNTKFK